MGNGPQDLQYTSCLSNLLKYVLKYLSFFKILLIKKNYISLILGGASMSHGEYVEVKGQFVAFTSLLPPGYQGLNPGLQPWW